MQQPDVARPLVELQAITKRYEGPSGTFHALDGVDLSVDAGEFVAIVGQSGSGKTTLLNIIAGIDRPSDGAATVLGTDVRALDEGAMASWRGAHVGVVFQFFQLLPTLTVAENVLLAMDFVGTVEPAARRDRALALLQRVGMAAHADKLPATLSGGEQQRVAIARALANDPPLLLADEPTGNLDSRTSAAIYELFEELVAEGKTLIVVTHAEPSAQPYSKVVHIADGRVGS